MQHLIDATRKAVQHKNWYAGLALALTMPDVCGRIAYPALKNRSEQRVVDWFDKYLAQNYLTGPTYHRQISMTGGDFYALRCAFLHQGEFTLEGQKARKVLERFHLTEPGPGIIHNNFSADMGLDGKLINSVLQLTVDSFCEEVCVAVETWLADVKHDQRIQNEINSLGKLHEHGTIR